jgi:hypothetical protein
LAIHNDAATLPERTTQRSDELASRIAAVRGEKLVVVKLRFGLSLYVD